MLLISTSILCKFCMRRGHFLLFNFCLALTNILKIFKSNLTPAKISEVHFLLRYLVLGRQRLLTKTKRKAAFSFIVFLAVFSYFCFGLTDLRFKLPPSPSQIPL